jgi:hypothetical protein
VDSRKPSSWRKAAAPRFFSLGVVDSTPPTAFLYSPPCPR